MLSKREYYLDACMVVIQAILKRGGSDNAW